MKRSITLICILCAIFCTSNAFSQDETSITCGSEGFNQTLMEKNPEWFAKWKQRQIEVRKKVNKDEVYKTPCSAATSIIIPIVVHYSTPVNCSNPQCLIDIAQAQIDVLNEDFGATNTDLSLWNNISSCFPGTDAATASDGTCIEFRLASRNHPATSGIPDGYPAITIDQFTFSTYGVPPTGAWPGYLNVYVSQGSPYLGYALNIGLDGANSGPDGIYVEAKVFGAPGVSCTSGVTFNNYAGYQLGRVGTHEVGHYLDLWHVFSGCGTGWTGGDSIPDTPPSSSPNYGNLYPSFNAINCSGSSNSCGSTSIFCNYMDYTEDASKFMFTSDQGDVMNAWAAQISWQNPAQVLEPAGTAFNYLSTCGQCKPAGTPCDDGDPLTFTDIEDGNCGCAGNPCPPAGTPCNDGDPTTGNDIADGLCGCAGTPCPVAGTVCNDNDASTYNDVEDGFCNCVGTPCPIAGTSCNDGDATTYNDLEDGFCNCVGTPCPASGTACDDGNPATYGDAEDGFCNCIGIPCTGAGTPCNDGDPSTYNDVEDGNCNCVGTPCPAAGTSCDDGDPSTYADSEDGLCNCSGIQCPAAGIPCNDGDPTTTNDAQDGFCNCVGDLCPAAGSPCNDNDPTTYNDVGDGFCNCVGTPCPTLGSACDDGNPATYNDTENGACNCTGTPCNLSGTPCNDFDATTYADAEDGFCNCVGIPCPAFGTPCNDNNPSTYNDIADGICGCFGISCTAAGTPCNDGNPATYNDVEDGDCNCYGTSCPFAGTPCSDSDATTYNDAEDGFCNCVGTPCPAVGTPCNDGNNSTYNDVADGSCGCAGTPCPASGTACDDGDLSTFNDVEDGSCNCAGTLCPASGTACSDGDPNTFNDVEDGFCNCSGQSLFQFQMRAFLEGYYDTATGEMTTELETLGLLPLNQPFNTLPWNYTGNEAVTTHPQYTSDWVLLQLHDANGTIIEEQAALINRFGYITNTTGGQILIFTSVPGNQSFSVSIHHKGHLAVITTVSSGDFVDFTLPNIANGFEQTKDKSGIEVLYSGDYDCNGIINSSDYNIWATNSAAVNYYLHHDADGNGVVNNLDANYWEYNKAKVGEPEIQY